jgi:hypothetical protein
VSRWKHDLDDDDRANLSHLMKLADVLETQAPIDIIEWNKALDSVSEKPHSKTKKKRRKRK